jgi:hypothetical protein
MPASRLESIFQEIDFQASAMVSNTPHSIEKLPGNGSGRIGFEGRKENS